MDLAGTPVGAPYGMIVGINHIMDPAANEVLCRQACCSAGASCTAYTFTTAAFAPNCYLYANVTNLVPNTLMRSAVLSSAYS